MKIAINIALIPEKSIWDWSISVGEKLYEKDNRYRLGDEAAPHLSLLHCIVDENDLNEIQSIVGNISKETNSLNLKGKNFALGPKSGLFHLNTENSSEIYALHTRVIEELKPYLHSEASKEMFVKPEEITIEIEWIESFLETSSFENYKLHITLGFGEVDVELPQEFIADKIAIYQIGKFGSCAKEIRSFGLK